MRKHLIHILCLFWVFFSLNSRAQNRSTSAAGSSSLFKHHHLLYFSHNLSITQTKPTLTVSPMLQQAPASEISSGSIKDMPFFCAMECRLRERTRLWIKFRTGDDASYEKLIHSGEK